MKVHPSKVPKNAQSTTLADGRNDRGRDTYNPSNDLDGGGTVN